MMKQCLRDLATVLARASMFVVLAIVPAAPALAADDEVPTPVRQEIEALLRQKVSDLVAQKDADGVPLKRGAWSRSFNKVNDATYEVTFHRDTIEDAVAGKDQMKTERLLLTVAKGPGGKWAIAKEEVKESFVGLQRPVVERKDAWKFDKFTFEREGLKVSASNGQIYQYLLLGKPVGFMLAAADLSYGYQVPPDVPFPWYAITLKRIQREHPEDLVFKPERLEVYCDPASCDEILTNAFTGLAKTDSAKIPKLQKVFDEEVKDIDKRYKENPFSQFYRPWEPDRRVWRLEFKRESAKEHYFGVSYDTWEPWEVSIYATQYYPALFAYYSEDVRKSGIPIYELERRDDADSRDYELAGLKGTVDVALDDPETVSGDIVFTMKTKRNLQVLPFAISRLRFPGQDAKESKNPRLFINSVQDGDGNEMTWVKRGGFGGLVFFPKEVPAGAEVKIRMQFENQQSIYALNPTYSAMDRGGWLPFVRFSDQIDDFDLTVRLPDKFTILGVGKKVSESRKDGVLTTRWLSPSPVSFPTIIFGEYFEDGPGTKEPAKKMDGTPIPVRVYVDKTSMAALNVESVRSMDQAQDIGRQFDGGARDIRGRNLQAIADQAVNAINLYREIYGIDYPFAKLDLVADPLGSFYGQAPASIIYLGFGVFKSEGALAAAGSQLTKFNKDVVAHETAHQWWGSAINNANFRHYWFVESLAELSSALYVEAVYGHDKYLEKVAQWRKTILDSDIMSSVQNGYTLWAGDTGGSPIANIYNKGPFAFHTLRQTFGDEKFFAYLKKLAQTLGGQEIVTRDIQRVTEESFGGNMEWFFDQWLRGVGIPQYSLNYTIRPTEDGKWLVEGTIKQRVVAGKNLDEVKGVYYRAVAPLTFVSPGGKKSRLAKPLLVQGPETPFKIKVADEPADVLFNAENEILAHDVLVNKSW